MFRLYCIRIVHTAATNGLGDILRHNFLHFKSKLYHESKDQERGEYYWPPGVIPSVNITGVDFLAAPQKGKGSVDNEQQRQW